MNQKTTNATMTSAKVLALALVLAMPAPARAVDNMESGGSVDLASVRAKIKARDYAAALAELRDLAEDTQQADVYNLLGFALRKTGDAATSLTYYRKALELEPGHRAAREYLGELFVETGRMAEARAELAQLARLCPGGCEEREDLERAIAGAGAKDGVTGGVKGATDAGG